LGVMSNPSGNDFNTTKKPLGNKMCALIIIGYVPACNGGQNNGFPILITPLLKKIMFC